MHSLDWLSGITVISSFSECSRTFLLGCMHWKSECFIFTFPVSSRFLISSCQVETPNKLSPLPSWFHPVCWQPTSAFCNSLISLWSTALSSFFQGLQVFSWPREKGEQKSMLKTLKERTRGKKWKEMSRRGKKRQNKHSWRVRTDYMFIFF